ncbi:MAG TPA: TonB-dependent siderophore receptor [Rhodanobacter sp.]
MTQNAAATAAPAAAVNFDIPAGSLATALTRFGRQAGVDIAYDDALVSGATTGGIHGSYATASGLAALLSGSQLGADPTAGGFVLHRSRPTSPAPQAAVGTPKEVHDLGDVRVYAIRVGYAATQADTATKTDTPIQEIPQSISVVTRDQMDDRGVQNLTDALHYAAGVRTDESSGSGVTQDNYYIRGFSQSGDGSYLDGLRQSYEPVDGAANTYGLERVEILRGPSSVLYGQNDPGGLINLVSKRPSDTPIHQLDLTYGRYDRRQVGADVGDRIDASGHWLFRVVAQYRDSDTETRHVPDDSVYVAPSVMWKPSDDTQLTLLAGYQRDRSAFSYGFVPQGSVLANPNGHLPWDFYSGDPSYSHKNTRRSWLGYEFSHRFNDTWTFTQNARYSGTRIDDYRLFPQGNYSVDFDDPSFGLALQSDGRTLDREALEYLWQVHMAQVDSHLTGHFDAGGVKQTLLLGVDYANIQDDNWLGSGPAPSLDIYAPVYGQPVATPGITDDIIHQRLTQTGIYAQDQLKFTDHWVALLGARQDYASQRQTDTALYLDPAATSINDQDTHKFTWHAGLVYLADNGLAPYVSYSTSFLPNTGTDAASRAFTPTTGKQVEVGLKYKPVGMDSFLTASLFNIHKQNVLTEDLMNPGFQIQTGEIRSQGLELEGVLDLNDHLDLIGSYSLTDIKVTKANDDSLGKVPTNVPRQMGSVWAAYKFGGKYQPGLRLGAGVRYVGSTYGDELNTVHIAPYTIGDVSASYDFEKVTISLNVDNVANKHYLYAFGGPTTNYAWYGTGRTWLASLRYVW